MDNDMQGRALLYSALVSAVSDGDLSRVEVLVYCFSPSSSQEWLEGYALLVDAIKQKHTEIAKLLIRNGAKVNSHCKEDSNAPLILAVMNDEDEIVNMLLNRGADIHVKNTRGYTPLHLAVVNGDIGIIVLLLRRGADVHVKDTRGYTSLHCAVEKSSEEMVTLLLDSNANVDAKATDGTTPLHIAAEKGHIQIAKVLLNHGADVHSVCNSTERDGYMPIHFSAQLGSEEAVRFFLRKGADVNAKAKDNLTPLHLAIKAHHEAVVKLLLEGGANVDARDKSGKTILHFAGEKGNSRIVEDVLKYCSDIINESNRSSLETTVQGSRDILQHGFIVNPEDVNNPELLHNAVTNGYLKTVGDLLKCGADVNMLDNSISGRGATPLHTAAMKNQVEIAKLLINYGANVNSKDKRERTPIFYAVEQEDAEIFKLLLTNGATIKDSPDLLFIAAKGRCLEIVEELLNCGIDVNMLDSSKSGRGNTALHYAVKVMENDAAKLLINYGANVNAKDNWGLTPIYYAIERNNEELTKLLLTNGANIKDSPEYLHIAIARGYVKIVEHLLMCGADVNYSDKQGRTALYIINRKRDLCVSVSSSVVNIDIHEREKIVELLLSNGANVNAKTEDGITALHAAVASGHSKIVEILLKFGAEVNFRDAYGRTALYIAIAGSGNAEIAKLLINYGANVHSKDKKEKTPIFYAVEQNNAEIIELFLTNGVNIKDRPDLLYTAAKAGCLETIEKLLKSGVDVNMSDKSMSGNSETALHFAAEYDQDDAVKLLINYGANVNAEDDWFDIPISHAIKMDNVEMTKLFLTNGANVKDYSKYLPIACARGCVEIVEDLLKYGVDVNYKYYDEMSWEEEWEEKTALYYIIRNKDMDQCIYSPTVNIDMDERIKIVQLLLSKGADVNAKTAYGISALHAAARYGYSEIIEILLNFGADIDSKDCYGRTALYIAVKEGHEQVVTDLLTNGIDINIVDEMGRTPLEFANDGAYDTDRHYDMYFSVNEYPRRLIPYVRIRISQILKDHIGKLKAAGFYVSKQNLKLISDDQYETYRFWYRCEREIHSMKDNKISNSDVSYYDILTKNTDQLAIYAENENIVQTLDTNDYKKKCRIYASMIEAKCRRCLVKQELTEIFNQFLNFLYKDLPVLPLHCTEKIFSGLSINDLQRLKHACQPLNSSNTSDSDAGSTSL